MALNWIDLTDTTFDYMFMLEKIQIKWLFDFADSEDLSIVLKANPKIKWFFEKKCPEIKNKIKTLPELDITDLQKIHETEYKIMKSVEDWMVYIIDPSIYENMKFLEWDSKELLELNDYNDKIILDIGSGTGKLAFLVSNNKNKVYCVEPVGSLRSYLKEKSKRLNKNQIIVVDGLITDIPFHDSFSDITMAGHVYGDDLEDEYNELMRVTKKNGMIILCPGNNDEDNDIHKYLISKGFSWSVFEEPTDGNKRKYWKIKEID